MDFVTTDRAPPAGGHYSQAVRANGFLFVAGQLPIKLDGGILEGVEAQARQALADVRATRRDQALIASSTPRST